MSITKELRVVTGSYVDKNGEKKNTYMTIGTYGTGPYGEFVSIYRSFNPAGVPYKEGSNSIFATLVDPQKSERK